jgi:hypothetical protein
MASLSVSRYPKNKNVFSKSLEPEVRRSCRGGSARPLSRDLAGAVVGKMMNWKEDELWDAVSRKDLDAVRAALRKVCA